VSNIIKGMSDLPSVDVITVAGRAAAKRHLLDIVPTMDGFEADVTVDLIARDWSHGEEERVFKTLSHSVDLTGAYRVVAAMVTASKGDEA
jgi:hypothetical protein